VNQKSVASLKVRIQFPISEKQVPFDYAQGKLSTTLRFAQDDSVLLGESEQF
jgi:hypothetical protein